MSEHPGCGSADVKPPVPLWKGVLNSEVEVEAVNVSNYSLWGTLRHLIYLAGSRNIGTTTPGLIALGPTVPKGAVSFFRGSCRSAVARFYGADPAIRTSSFYLIYTAAFRSVVHVTFDGRVTQEAIDKLIFFLEGSKDTFPSSKEVERVRQAVWHGRGYDQVVRVTGLLGESGGKRYFAIEGSDSGIPEDELDFEGETFAT
jgi:hypothetical protein